MMASFLKKDLASVLKNIFLILFGTAVLAFGTAVFIVPFDLVTGGVSGLAIVIRRVLDDLFNIQTEIDLHITLLTWVLFFLGLFFLGRGFAAKTLVSTVFYPVFFSLFYDLVNPNVLGGIFVLQGSEYKEIAVLLAALFGGAFVGAGCALTFLAGGSTGGVDVIAFLICKYNKKIKSSHVIFIVDAVIVTLGMFIIGDIVVSLLGICSAFVCSAVVDRLFLGSSQAYVAQIVAENHDRICREVIEKMDRTATVVDAVGAYSGENKKMIIVSFSMHEYSELRDIINREDPNAFMTVSRAYEMHGEGWTREKK